MREQEIFVNALAISEPREQAAFLDQACGEDHQLREHVAALLAAHQQMGSFLEGRPDVVLGDTTDQSIGFREGEIIAGRYKLLEAIGEGGMGTVWVAEQAKPIRRKVALKLVKPGMDSRQVLARFSAERQALALMDHPNIAKVYDGGLTEQGRPYFVMEYVKGVPLMQFCDDAQMPLRERLQLFTAVCQAVQHAHQKGIIHRDLKPSNILVCLYDGKPVAKVIDFGLAKAMHQSLTEQSLYTAHGVMVGTPLYMSPEQAEFNNLDIDTRSDIYSLGVILYELLTGTTPLQKQQFHKAALNEILRLIKEVEPVKPSTRLSGSASLPSIAAQRRLDPGKLTRSIRGDLDWIVMKSLEKERSRRYETANGLARDIERYLNDEAVEACPPSMHYKFRKFLHRNKKLVGFGLLLFASLAVGIVGTAWGFYTARLERDEANTAREAETQQRQLAELASRKAISSAKLANEQKLEAIKQSALAVENSALALAIKDFLQNDLLLLADPQTQESAGLAPDPEIKLRALLDRAASRIDQRFDKQPRVRAEVQAVLAKVYMELGLDQKAVDVGEKSRIYFETTQTIDNATYRNLVKCLADAYLHLNQPNRAIKLMRELLLREKSNPASDPREILEIEWFLASCGGLQTTDDPYANWPLKQTKAVYEKAKTLLAEEDPLRIRAAIIFVEELIEREKFAEANDLLETMLPRANRAFSPINFWRIRALRSQANLQYGLDHKPEAIALLQDILRTWESMYGKAHTYTHELKQELAIYLVNTGRNEEAIVLLEEMLADEGKTLKNPQTVRSLLIMAYLVTGDLEGQERMQRALVAYYRADFLKNNIHMTVLCQHLDAHAGTLLELSQYAQAETAIREILDLLQSDPANNQFLPQREIHMVQLGLSSCLIAQAKFAEAEQILVTLDKEFRGTAPSVGNFFGTSRLFRSIVFNTEDLQLIDECTIQLASLYWQWNRPDTASGYLQKLNATQIFNFWLIVSRNYADRAQYAEMENALRMALVDAKRVKAKTEEVMVFQALLGKNLILQEKYQEAREILKVCQEWRVQNQPEEWTTYNAHSLLGEALVGELKYADAEPLLLKGYAGLKDRAEKIPDNLRKKTLEEAQVRLFKLYSAWEMPEKAKQWEVPVRKNTNPAKPLLASTAPVDAPAKLQSEDRQAIERLITESHNLMQLNSYAEAEPLLRQCLAIYKAKSPDHWEAFHVQSLLGAALLGQKKYSQAEPLLLSGYRGMQERDAHIPALSKSRLTNALDHLVTLYQTLGEESKYTELLSEFAKTIQSGWGVEDKQSELKLYFLVETYSAQNKDSLALKAVEDALKICQVKYSPLHPQTLRLKMLLGNVLESAGRYAEAERIYQELITQSKSPGQNIDARVGMVSCFLRQGKSQEASRLANDLLREKLARSDAADALELTEKWRKLEAAATDQKGVPGQEGLEFDGDLDYVIIPSLHFDGQPPWTLEAIVKPTSYLPGIDSWISLISATDAGSMSLETLDNRWSIALCTTNYHKHRRYWTENYSMATSRGVLRLRKWQHVAGVWDGKELRLYLNGKLQEVRKDVNRCTRLSGLCMMVGADPDSYFGVNLAHGYFQGTMRAVRISRGVEYTDSFTSPENLQKTPQTAALFDFTVDSGDFAFDQSGNGNHGIVIGARYKKPTP
ncbi:MAG: protein kinase [Pirellulales bacterium]|nr:protein kinase [Pirellulales bacterium]